MRQRQVYRVKKNRDYEEPWWDRWGDWVLALVFVVVLCAWILTCVE